MRGRVVHQLACVDPSSHTVTEPHPD